MVWGTENDKGLTIAEAATMLGYTRQHTRLLIREGKLRGTKVGRDWVVWESHVREFIARRSSGRLFRKNEA